MAILITCACGKVLKFRDEYERSMERCPECGARHKLPARGEAAPTGPVDPFGLDDRGMDGGSRPQRREYLIVTQQDKGFLGRFEPEKIAQVVNAYAKKGWVVRSMATARLGTRDEIVIMLEREL